MSATFRDVYSLRSISHMWPGIERAKIVHTEEDGALLSQTQASDLDSALAELLEFPAAPRLAVELELAAMNLIVPGQVSSTVRAIRGTYIR